jgi:large subunit ribosomal protein L20
MSRIKRGTIAHKRRKYLLSRAKSYLGRAHKNFRAAKERLLHADKHAYISRRLRKREFRRLWITRINGALDQINSNLNYSRLMNLLAKSGSRLNRKSLSEIAIRDLETFRSLVNSLVGSSYS